MEDWFRSLQRLAEALGMPPLVEPVGLDALIPYFETMRSEGAVVLLKWDGERGSREHPLYTGLVSGGKLSKGFHTDAKSLSEAAAYVIVNYARACWGFEG